MVFVVCCLVREGSSTPIKDWFGCTLEVDIILSDLYREFCNGKFDDDPIEDDVRCSFSCVKVGSNKVIKDFTNVSSSSSVIDVVKNLGSFVMFVIPPAEKQHAHNARANVTNVFNVFSVLMENAHAKSISLPPQFSEQRHLQKSKLKNDILKWLETNSLGWSPDSVKSLGLTFVNTLSDAMWYINQNHATLSSRGYHVPETLRCFSGYRNPEQQKKRKIDQSFLQQDELKAHGSALYNLALASHLKKDSWASIRTAILSLADSLTKYGNYLASQNKCVSAYFIIFLHKQLKYVHVYHGDCIKILKCKI